MSNVSKQEVLALCICLIASFPVLGQWGNEYLGSGALSSVDMGDCNVAIGDSAGAELTYGNYSTFLGWGAGKWNGESDNVFLGYKSGYGSIGGGDNTFVGARTGLANIAYDNTFIGTEAGMSNTSGYDNTFIGEEAGSDNTTGDDNVFIGEDAGRLATEEDDNVFIGSSAGYYGGTGVSSYGSQEDSWIESYTINSNPLEGEGNVGIGASALYDIQSGQLNTAIGHSAGVDIGGGNGNTFIGGEAGSNTESGDHNTFVGALSGCDNNRTNSADNANDNTYVGFMAGYTNRDGSNNVGMGAFADFMSNTSTGVERNVFIGSESDIRGNDITMLGFSGYVYADKVVSAGANHEVRGTAGIGLGYAVNLSPDADYSVSIGFEAQNSAPNTIGLGRSNMVSGTGSIVIGANSTVSGENSIALGSDLNLSAANTVFLGNAATTSIGGTVNWTATSDARMKTAVRQDVPGLPFIKALRPVTYNYDSAALLAQFGGASACMDEKDAMRFTGFLAQEVAKVAEGMGYDFSGVDVPTGENEVYGIRYSAFVVPLVQAVQELSALVDRQGQLILEQQAALEALVALQSADLKD
jgi:hypothetical protein